MESGKVQVVTAGEPVEFYFRGGGYYGRRYYEYAVARTEKQQLTYNEAKERCQRLGGDLPNLRNNEGVMWQYRQDGSFQTGIKWEDFNKVMKAIMKITGEKFEKFWIGEGNKKGERWNCMERYKGEWGDMDSITFGNCQSSQTLMIDSFLCQLKRA